MDLKQIVQGTKVEQKPVVREEAKAPSPRTYQGLVLIESTRYLGPTSIRYWM